MVNDNDIVDFGALELEGDDDDTGTSQKLMEHMKFLKEKLSPEDYSKAVKDLGFNTDLSNEDLLAEIKALLGLKKEDPVEDEDPNKDKNLMSYKDFVEKCMAEGKTLKDCAAAYKEKYPEAEEPTKEEEAELKKLELELAKKKPVDDEEEPDKKMKALEDKITALTASVEDLTKSREQEKNTAELSVEVEKLVEEKQLAPSQKAGILKLAANMSLKDQTEMLHFFRTTQRLSGLFDDKGLMQSSSQGGRADISPERRAELIKTFKIDEIIEDKGVKRKVNN